MNLNTIIVNSELEFRKYIEDNFEEVVKIYVFEDTLDNTIFFYLFAKNNVIVATKELSMNNFSYYYKLYSLLAKKLKLYSYNLNKSKTLKLIKR